VVSSRFSKRTQIWIDVFGFIVFLTPMCLAVLWYGMPFFTRAFVSGEMSSNAGGLIRWPVSDDASGLRPAAAARRL
jgi:TRAP-type mannitol/chloroaromatic compound transport system permease small subunit